jgi:hypothetical protein
MRSPDDFLKRITMTRNALAMDSASVQSPPLNATIPRSLREGELPLGRGFLVKSGKTQMLQIATPYNQDEPVEVVMDRWVEKIIEIHGDMHAQWIPMPEDDEQAQAAASDKPATNGNTRSTETTAAAAPAHNNGFTAEKVEDLRKQLVAMYEGVGLPADMVKDLPPSGIIEMAQMRGLIEPPVMEA